MATLWYPRHWRVRSNPKPEHGHQPELPTRRRFPARPLSLTTGPECQRFSTWVENLWHNDRRVGLPAWLASSRLQGERLDGLSPVAREQVAIATTHGLRLVPHELVDDPLVDAGRSQI